MPEYNLSLLTENSVQEPLHVQNKLCSLCHSIVEPTSFLFLPIGLCQACRDANTSIRSLPVAAPTRSSRIDVDVAHPHPLIVDGTNIAQSTRRAPVEDIDVLTPQPLDHQHYSTRVSCPPPRRHAHPSTSTPSPFTDITRIRVRSQGHHCLYPGATFQGTQKSGRNSYDVNVTIVDVDFSSSFLCGYLRIRGLTDDWPELTTYFDAEIIGSRYGFLTQNWGANEQEDTVHWSRFPAFRNVKHELAKPMLTMPDRDRGAVFMRWKERFLVPDHRVQDINGASFAGFYYVCVDFNPPAPQSTRSTSQHVPLTREEEDSPTIPAQSLKIETGLGRNRERGRSGRSASRTAGPPVATMSGFYFHQNSEPYQQLSLCHVPERTNSSFEFR